MIDKIGIALCKYRFQLGRRSTSLVHWYHVKRHADFNWEEDPRHWYIGTVSRDMLCVDRLGDERRHKDAVAAREHGL